MLICHSDEGKRQKESVGVGRTGIRGRPCQSTPSAKSIGSILPPRKDAPTYMARQARPDFGQAGSVAGLQRVEIMPRCQLQLTAR